MADVIMPQMGESIAEGTVTRWMKSVGDPVERDEPLFEISTDKVDAEIPSPAAGVLREIRVPPGTTVPVNSVVGVIADKAEETTPDPPVAAAAPEPPAASPPDSPPQAPPPPTVPPAPAAPRPPAAPAPPVVAPAASAPIPPVEYRIEGEPPPPAPEPPPSPTRAEMTDDDLRHVRSSPVVRRIAAEHGVDLGAVAGTGIGGRVTKQDILGHIDGRGAAPEAAASAEAPPVAEAAPVSEAPPAPEGPGPETPSAIEAPPQREAPEAPRASEEPPKAKEPPTREAVPAPEAPAAPAARSAPAAPLEPKAPPAPAAPPRPEAPLEAKEPPRDAVPSPDAPPAPKVLSAPEARPATAAPPETPAPPATPPPEAGPAAPPTSGGGGPRVEVVPMSPIRKRTAEHMVLSQRTSAHVSTVFEVDMTRVDHLRRKHQSAWEETSGVRLTYMPFILKAVIDALKVFPVLNARIDGESIVYHRDVNVGVAVALDRGLIVPVVHRADEKNLLGLARAVIDLAHRARTKKLQVGEVQGGTFTITNPGVFGSLFGTPIINQPQVAILGVGTIEKRPVVRDDAIAIRTMAYFALTFDHRLVDGADADRFMAHIKTTLQEFDEAVL